MLGAPSGFARLLEHTEDGGLPFCIEEFCVRELTPTTCWHGRCSLCALQHRYAFALRRQLRNIDAESEAGLTAEYLLRVLVRVAESR